MNKLVIVAVAVLAASAASAYLGEVVASFPVPGSGVPHGLATSGDILYVYNPSIVYRCDPETGSFISSCVCGVPGGWGHGIGYSYGGYIWVCGDVYLYKGWVGKYDEATGSLYSSFTDAENAMLIGMAVQGIPDKPGTFESLLVADYYYGYGKNVHRYTATGGKLYGFRYSEGWGDPAWDYNNRLTWIPDDSAIYGYDTKGSLISSFAPPPVYDVEASTYYANYLWIATDNPDFIWKIHCPGPAAVDPASVGRVKALYR
jgi:hypothetical protein